MAALSEGVCAAVVSVTWESSMSRPIQLHADLAIDPAREVEALHYLRSCTGPPRVDSRVTSTFGC